MVVIVNLVSALFFFAAFGCYVLVLQHAFRKSLKMGLLCSFIPPYGLFYYAFSKFTHRSKKPILIAGIILGLVSIVGFATADSFGDEEEEIGPSDSLRNWGLPESERDDQDDEEEEEEESE